jgi:hypothetical protein
MLRTVLLVAGAVLALAAVWWLAIDGPRPVAPPGSSPERPPAPEQAAPPEPAAPAESQPRAQIPQPSAAQNPAPEPTEKSAEPAPEQPRREGPVDELSAAFDKEPRDSAAADVEAAVQRDVRELNIPSRLFRGVLCRSTVCRIQLRWEPELRLPYMMLMTRLASEFSDRPGIDPAPAPDAQGTLALDVYWRRQQPQ